MRAIMISIQPQWVEKILNGEKTIEIRKTMPKCELPCKVYIYCTKNEKQYFSNVKCCESLLMDSNSLGKVVAEFTFNKVKEYGYVYSPALLMQGYYTKRGKELDYSKCCLKLHEIEKYADDGKILPKPIYAWYIDNLKIYDKPKELSVFKKQNACYVAGSWEELGCWECCCTFQELGDCDGRCSKLERPPQSWCYVEELEVVDE